MALEEALPAQLTEFEVGIVIGLLIGEGSFGGDGRQPQITLKMHVRHERLLRWLADRFPRTRLYGPYSYDGRTFYQWMARGRPLVEDVLPYLDQAVVDELDEHAGARLRAMHERYADYIARVRRSGG